MPIDLSAVGQERGPREVWWNESHCLLYAIAVGCGPDDLEFITENTGGVPQLVLPTFATVAGAAYLLSARPGEVLPLEPGANPGPIDLGWGLVDQGAVRHASSRVELARPLPTSGRVHVWSKVTSVWDKGESAIVNSEGRALDADTGELLYTNSASLYVRGEGGFGGERGPSGPQHVPPERPPDEVVTYQTSPMQSYLFRLVHGRHPVHSDPEFARSAGAPRPILAGTCTYGFTGRAILERLCGGDPERFISMEGRFSSPVFPGDALTVKMWVEGKEAVFTTEVRDGEVAISQGHCTFA